MFLGNIHTWQVFYFCFSQSRELFNRRRRNVQGRRQGSVLNVLIFWLVEQSEASLPILTLPVKSPQKSIFPETEKLHFSGLTGVINRSCDGLQRVSVLIISTIFWRQQFLQLDISWWIFWKDDVLLGIRRLHCLSRRGEEVGRDSNLEWVKISNFQNLKFRFSLYIQDFMILWKFLEIAWIGLFFISCSCRKTSVNFIYRWKIPQSHKIMYIYRK